MLVKVARWSQAAWSKVPSADAWLTCEQRVQGDVSTNQSCYSRATPAWALGHLSLGEALIITPSAQMTDATSLLWVSGPTWMETLQAPPVLTLAGGAGGNGEGGLGTAGGSVV
jgi:hypothetical protein